MQTSGEEGSEDAGQSLAKERISVSKHLAVELLGRGVGMDLIDAVWSVSPTGCYNLYALQLAGDLPSLHILGSLSFVLFFC